MARDDRADRAVAAALGVSRRRAEALLESGRVRHAGRRLLKGERLRAGISLDVELGDERPLPPAPEAPLAVLREAAGYVVLDKPADQPCHPLRPGELGTLANALVARYPECEAAGARPREGGLCHRLDTETSGAILAARTPEAFAALRAQFAERSVLKVYRALVRGRPAQVEGRVELPLVGRGRSRVWRSAHDGRAVPAVTRYRLLAERGPLALFEVTIETGARHQIRVHLAALGHPLAGDALYGGGEAPAGHAHQLLHAWRLGFRDPDTGAAVEVTSPPPPELRA